MPSRFHLQIAHASPILTCLTHALILIRMQMEYQTRRGGRVKLGALAAPPNDFNHPEKGGVLNAVEMSLALERLNFEKLRKLHDAAEQCGDADMQNFVENMLDEQVIGFVWGVHATWHIHFC